MNHNHYRILCQFCEAAISQCRCMSKEKTIKKGVCKDCARKGHKLATGLNDFKAAQELTEKLRQEPPGRIRIVGKMPNGKNVLTGAMCHVYVMNADGTETELPWVKSVKFEATAQLVVATLEVFVGELDLEGIQVVAAEETKDFLLALPASAE